MAFAVLGTVGKYALAGLAGFEVIDKVTSIANGKGNNNKNPPEPNYRLNEPNVIQESNTGDYKILLFVVLGFLIFVVLFQIGSKLHSSARKSAERDLRFHLENRD